MSSFELQPAPAERIERLKASFAGLSDTEVLAVLQSVEPLPDAADDDPVWNNDEAFDRAYLLVAIADEIGDRRLVHGIAPLFGMMALGDGYEMMQSILDGPERAVGENWAILLRVILPLTEHTRAGTRRSSIRELGVFREPDSLRALLRALEDSVSLVRQEACTSLGMLAQTADAAMRSRILESLTTAAEDGSDEVRSAAEYSLRSLAGWVSGTPMRTRSTRDIRRR